MRIQINIDMEDNKYHNFNKQHGEEGMIIMLHKVAEGWTEQLNNDYDFDCCVYLHCIDDNEENTLYD